MLAARRYREGDLVRAGFYSALESFQVRCERNYLQAVYFYCLLNNLSGIGHRRDQLRRHERADLDLGEPGAGERADPGLLRFRRHQVLGVLQAVARPDFADLDLGHAAILAPRRQPFLDSSEERTATRGEGGEGEHRPQRRVPAAEARGDPGEGERPHELARLRGLQHQAVRRRDVLGGARVHWQAGEDRCRDDPGGHGRGEAQPETQRGATRARASGPTTWPACEACSTRPFAVAMCWGVRACIGRPAKIDAGMNPAVTEKARTRPKRSAPGSDVASMPASQAAARSAPAMIRGPRGTPRERSHPPSRFPGTFTSTMSAVANAAAPEATAYSSVRKVGSQSITELHCAT